MKILFLGSILVIVSYFGYVSGDEYDVLDEIDYVALAKNPKELRRYFACINRNKGCTPQYNKVRNLLPDLLKTCCARCSEEFLRQFKVFIDTVWEVKPAYEEKALEIFDPTGEYVRNCDKKWKSKGIDLLRFEQ